MPAALFSGLNEGRDMARHGQASVAMSKIRGGKTMDLAERELMKRRGILKKGETSKLDEKEASRIDWKSGSRFVYMYLAAWWRN